MTRRQEISFVLSRRARGARMFCVHWAVCIAIGRRAATLNCVPSASCSSLFFCSSRFPTQPREDSTVTSKPGARNCRRFAVFRRDCGKMVLLRSVFCPPQFESRRYRYTPRRGSPQTPDLMSHTKVKTRNVRLARPRSRGELSFLRLTPPPPSARLFANSRTLG